MNTNPTPTVGSTVTVWAGQAWRPGTVVTVARTRCQVQVRWMLKSGKPKSQVVTVDIDALR